MRSPDAHERDASATRAFRRDLAQDAAHDLAGARDFGRPVGAQWNVRRREGRDVARARSLARARPVVAGLALGVLRQRDSARARALAAARDRPRARCTCGAVSRRRRRVDGVLGAYPSPRAATAGATSRPRLDARRVVLAAAERRAFRAAAPAPSGVRKIAQANNHQPHRARVFSAKSKQDGKTGGGRTGGGTPQAHRGVRRARGRLDLRRADARPTGASGVVDAMSGP